MCLRRCVEVMLCWVITLDTLYRFEAGRGKSSYDCVDNVSKVVGELVKFLGLESLELRHHDGEYE